MKSYITFYLFCQKNEEHSLQSRVGIQSNLIIFIYYRPIAWQICTNVPVLKVHKHERLLLRLCINQTFIITWAWNLSLNKLIWRVDSAKAEDLSRILLQKVNMDKVYAECHSALTQSKVSVKRNFVFSHLAKLWEKNRNIRKN